MSAINLINNFTALNPITDAQRRQKCQREQGKAAEQFPV